MSSSGTPSGKREYICGETNKHLKTVKNCLENEFIENILLTVTNITNLILIKLLDTNTRLTILYNNY